jgi:hypothetical protein
MKRRDVQCPVCRATYSVRKITFCHCNGTPNRCTSVSLQRTISHVTGQRPEPIQPTSE